VVNHHLERRIVSAVGSHTPPAAAADDAAEPTDAELVDLLQVAVARVRAHFGGVTAQVGVTPTQAKALRYLDEPITLSDLTARLGADMSNTSTVVDRLEAQGLLRRETHGLDRRSRLLTLTAEGIRVRRTLQEAAFDHVPALAALAAEQRRQLFTLLTVISGPA
jgi:DNA-binding MarR family transcriptional regulator